MVHLSRGGGNRRVSIDDEGLTLDEIVDGTVDGRCGRRTVDVVDVFGEKACTAAGVESRFDMDRGYSSNVRGCGHHPRPRALFGQHRRKPQHAAGRRSDLGLPR